MSGGKRSLSHCDRHLHHSHATVTDGYTPCPISGHVSYPYLTCSYHEQNYLQKVTEMDGREWRHTYEGTVLMCKRDSDRW